MKSRAELIMDLTRETLRIAMEHPDDYHLRADFRDAVELRRELQYETDGFLPDATDTGKRNDLFKKLGVVLCLDAGRCN